MSKYVFAAALCLLFVMFALGAVLDPVAQDLRPKITGTVALAAAAANLGYQTKPEFSSGLRRTSIALIGASVVLIPLLWFVR